ncbi:DUF2892 domain-containing protein [Candidatus Acetothermia bacterium]|nr:DUF2892 domain-containing protein [Candidatus Acetothermia bacterium]MBI3643922.1 DUF2892 domain-containing protein [Candidatus Acetothermia bacterium]
MARLTCNIDRAGRIYRVVLGVVIMATAILAFLLLPASMKFWVYVISGLLTLVGAFTIFEAAVGWCAIRAMGFKTRL